MDGYADVCVPVRMEDLALIYRAAKGDAQEPAALAEALEHVQCACLEAAVWQGRAELRCPGACPIRASSGA